MKKIIVSGDQFQCSILIPDNLAPDDLISHYQGWLTAVMKFAIGAIYSKRVDTIANKLRKIIEEEKTILIDKEKK